jgi:diadenosine tetraphosphate (Ap4A) HIT family hydrolase
VTAGKALDDDRRSCVFCDPASFKETLVAEKPNFWVAATRGQITDGGHLLIIPKGHVLRLAELHDTKSGPFLALTEEVEEVLAQEYRQPVGMFEHGGPGQSVKHAHLQIFPGLGTDRITNVVKKDFPFAETCALRYLDDLFESYERKPEPYLFWKGESGFPFVCWNPPNVPVQYLRLVLAGIRGCPERGNWRTMDQELDKRLIAETIQRLKPRFA